jgi:nicotinamidase-related amidase
MVQKFKMAAARASLALPTPATTVLLLCDIQEKFRPLIWKFPAVVASAQALTRACASLGVRCVTTEQNPARLGGTVAELRAQLPAGAPVFGKTKFSMLTAEVDAALAGGEGGGARVEHAVLCGIESHVCVYQTAMELLQRRVQVHVVVDGVSSQRRGDRAVALASLSAAGAALTTTEAVIFQLLGDAAHPGFKEVQKGVMEHLRAVREGPEDARGLDVLQ